MIIIRRKHVSIYKKLAEQVQLVSKLTGMVVPANKAVVGANAFAHESGIHQDGVLKEKSTYEIISPELVGFASNNLVLGKLSGRHAFIKRLEELGFVIEDDQVNDLFAAFKDLADRKKEMTDDDLVAIVLENKISKDDQYYQLLNVGVQSVENEHTATITLSGRNNEKNITETGTGKGSVEAVYNTLEKMVDESVNLLDYRIQSVGGGRDALAQVFVKMRCADVETSGRGLAQDVIEASAKAYLNAINRVLYLKENEDSELVK